MKKTSRKTQFFTWMQKVISGITLFCLFFSITFRFPGIFFDVSAGNKDFYNLVSVLVSEDVYDDISSQVEQYAKDVQKKLENTRVVILPTPVDATPFQIASLQESLYYE